MDQSKTTASDAQNQTPSDQPVSSVQQPMTTPPVQSNDSIQAQTPPQQKTQISVGNVEAGAVSIVQESADATAEDDEDKVVVAPQETKNQVISQGGGMDSQEEAVEMHPSAAEAGLSVSKEVEPFVEKVPGQEKPALTQEVQDAGVTHS